MEEEEEYGGGEELSVDEFLRQLQPASVPPQAPIQVTLPSEFLNRISGDLYHIIVSIDNALAGRVYNPTTGQFEPRGKELIPEDARKELITLLISYLNPNTLFSNWNEQRINVNILNLAIPLSFRLEEFKQQYNLTETQIDLIYEIIIHQIESSYRRALGEGERKFVWGFTFPKTEEKKRSLFGRLFGK